jgi:hypothetical protein
LPLDGLPVTVSKFAARHKIKARRPGYGDESGAMDHPVPRAAIFDCKSHLCSLDGRLEISRREQTSELTRRREIRVEAFKHYRAI